MNKLIAKIGATIVTLTVLLFAVFMIVDIPVGSYLVCMILPIGYIMMALSIFLSGFLLRRRANLING